MMVPGSNLLNQALSVIAATSMTYIRWVSRAQNAMGDWVNTYATPVTVRGSWQPVPRSMIQTLGLVFERSYVNIFVPQTVLDVQRDVSSDQFQFNSQTFQVISVTPWHAIDGWVQVLAVRVQNAG